VHIDDLIAPALSHQLRSVLPRAGLALSEASAGATRVVDIDRLERVPEPAGPVVALNGGRLSPRHAAALRRTPPALILACREPPGVPSEWELQALARLLAGGPLPPPDRSPRPFRLTEVSTLQKVSAAAAEAAMQAGARKNAADIAADVMHELAANALFDAPAFPDGTPKYAHRRGPELQLDPGDIAEVSIQASGQHVFLSAIDPFGRLKASSIAAALDRLDEPHQVNGAGGGAGLGLRRILEQSDLIAVRINPGKRCEVTCAVELGSARRRAANPKSLFFWVEH